MKSDVSGERSFRTRISTAYTDQFVPVASTPLDHFLAKYSGIRTVLKYWNKEHSLCSSQPIVKRDPKPSALEGSQRDAGTKPLTKSAIEGIAGLRLER